MEPRMNIRKTLLIASLTAGVVPAAFADNFIGGEIGYESHPIVSTVTREQVKREYEAFRAHPVQSDGAVYIQGELGAVSPAQGAFADRTPSTPHTHVMGAVGQQAVATTAAPLTDAERRAIREQYIN